MRLKSSHKALLMLKNTEGIGTVKTSRIMDVVKSVEDIYDNITAVRESLIYAVGHKLYEEILKKRDTIDFVEIEKKINEHEVKIISICDKEYPFLLKQFDDKPLMLYCKGNVELISTSCFAVVGTRLPTKYGVRVTEDFVSVMSKRFTIISGLASGIDTIAHRVTLQNRGKTIAVLGNGIERVYPPENLQLYNEIAEKGLIISEYDIGTQPLQYNFPARNRIISGLSRGVLVTEAGIKSGTMSTINHAVSQGREVFCVPGSIYNKASSGCNKSIKDCQSIAVTHVNDIFEGVGLKAEEETKPSAMKLDVMEERIIEFLDRNGEQHFEEILNEVDLTVPQLNSLLIKLSTRGIINKSSNNYWSV